MGIFDQLKDRRKVIDLTDNENVIIKKKKEDKTTPVKESSPLGFFSNISSHSSETKTSKEMSDDGKRKLKDILRNMDDRIEKLSIDTYRLQQKIELLEKKLERKK